MDFIRCPVCAEMLHPEAARCPRCGKTLPTAARAARPVAPAPPPTASPTPPPPTPPPPPPVSPLLPPPPPEQPPRPTREWPTREWPTQGWTPPGGPAGAVEAGSPALPPPPPSWPPPPSATWAPAPRPAKSNLTRNLVIGAAAAVVAFLGVIALLVLVGHRSDNGVPDSYTPELESAFVKGCTGSGGTSKQCECVLSEVERQYTIDEFVAMTNDYQKTRTYPPRMTAIARRCISTTPP